MKKKEKSKKLETVDELLLSPEILHALDKVEQVEKENELKKVTKKKEKKKNKKTVQNISLPLQTTQRDGFTLKYNPIQTKDGRLAQFVNIGVSPDIIQFQQIHMYGNRLHRAPVYEMKRKMSFPITNSVNLNSQPKRQKSNESSIVS